MSLADILRAWVDHDQALFDYANLTVDEARAVRSHADEIGAALEAGHARQVAALTLDGERLKQQYETVKATHESGRESVYWALGIRGQGANTHNHALQAVKGLQERVKFTESFESEVYARKELEARVQALDAAASWQPIDTAPHYEDVVFWIVPTPPEEAYTNSSGKPIVGVFEPHEFRGKWRRWSALSKATHWRRDVRPAPPAADRRPTEET